MAILTYVQTPDVTWKRVSILRPQRHAVLM